MGVRKFCFSRKPNTWPNFIRAEVKSFIAQHLLNRLPTIVRKFFVHAKEENVFNLFHLHYCTMFTLDVIEVLVKFLTDTSLTEI